MRLAAFESDEAAQRADIAGRNLEPRVLAAQLIVKHANGEIVAAGEQNGVGNLLGRPQEFNRHLLAGVQPLVERRNPQHAVGLDHGRNDPGPAPERIGNQPLADLAQTDPHKLFQAQPRGDLARQDGLHLRRLFGRPAQQVGQQGADNLLTDDDRRHRVAGQTDHRFAIHDGENRRLAGHDVDAVDQHLANRLQGA